MPSWQKNGWQLRCVACKKARKSIFLFQNAKAFYYWMIQWKWKVGLNNATYYEHIHIEHTTTNIYIQKERINYRALRLHKRPKHPTSNIKHQNNIPKQILLILGLVLTAIVNAVSEAKISRKSFVGKFSREF